MNEFALASQLAAALGAQALPWFFVGLALLLVGLAGVHALLHRFLFRPWSWPPLGQRARAQPAPLSPAGLLLRRLLLGFAVVVAAAWAFAEIADALGDGRGAGQIDQIFSDAVRAHLAPPAYAAFALLTRLADTATLVVIGAVVALGLLVMRRPWLATGWLLALCGNALLNVTLKAVFARARPVHDAALVQAQGFSFPSGHSSGAVVAYGMLAYVLLRCLPPRLASRLALPLMLLAAALAYAIGSSRVFLQVHFATDVLAGFASGSVWLAICIGSMELVAHRQMRADATSPADEVDPRADGKVGANSYSGK
jgi:membrane-associated phospholipid phosphatase